MTIANTVRALGLSALIGSGIKIGDDTYEAITEAEKAARQTVADCVMCEYGLVPDDLTAEKRDAFLNSPPVQRKQDARISAQKGEAGSRVVVPKIGAYLGGLALFAFLHRKLSAFAGYKCWAPSDAVRSHQLINGVPVMSILAMSLGRYHKDFRNSFHLPTVDVNGDIPTWNQTQKLPYYDGAFQQGLRIGGWGLTGLSALALAFHPMDMATMGMLATFAVGSASIPTLLAEGQRIKNK